MKPSAPAPPAAAPVDADLAEQARPGHGIPSQDTNANAQVPLRPEEAEREARGVLTGGGAAAGAATGALIGVAVAGPVGVLVGGTAGALAGALGAAAVGAQVDLGSAASAEATATGSTGEAETEVRADTARAPGPAGRTHPKG